MAIRNLRYENDDILRKKSKQIDVIDEKIKELAQDMIDTMHKYDGVGLAAVQIGILKRIIVIDLYDGNKPYVLINPVIIKQSGNKLCDEGCLSYPNKFAKVERPDKLEVEYTTLENKRVKLKAKDLLAQAICHECDHLEGIVFVDRMKKGTLHKVLDDGSITYLEKEEK